MCGVCRDTESINGRVDFISFFDAPSRSTSATNGFDFGHIEGNAVPCPYCQPQWYGTVRKITAWKE
jgi:hypothetical protein